nr:phosphoribosylformylglycinamidine synthase subunit PurQ [Coxiella-like endosymbiont of Rhipicephalus sanguineus]
MRFIDPRGILTIDYPANSNGSLAGITGLTTNPGWSDNYSYASS